MPMTLPHKVLIVEDDTPIRNLYSLKIKNSGYAVQTASDGKHGLEIAEVFRPDLILLDLRMPLMSGEEMLIRLRQSEWGSGIRVMILTNISKSEAPHSLRFLNVERYIVKVHHTPAQIIEMIKEVF